MKVNQTRISNLKFNSKGNTKMKAINYIITIFQGALVTAYILFYNVQYYWSLKSTVQNLISLIF